MTSHVFFFFNDTATTEIYTLSLHDALPIFCEEKAMTPVKTRSIPVVLEAETAADLMTPNPLSIRDDASVREAIRSEEHTSELQSPMYLVCRLLLEKKKKKYTNNHTKKKQEK